MKEYPWGKGTPKALAYDDAANDSDKSFTVPAGKWWMITGMTVQYNASAAAGNRVFRVLINDGTHNVYESLPPAAQTASQEKTYYLGGYRSESAFVGENLRNGYMTLPSPLVLGAGSTIRVYDVTAVAAAADDMTVSILGVEYDA